MENIVLMPGEALIGKPLIARNRKIARFWSAAVGQILRHLIASVDDGCVAN